MSVMTTTPDNEGVFTGVTMPPNEALKNALILTQSTVNGLIEGDHASMTVPVIKTPPTAELVAEGAEFNETLTPLDAVSIKNKKIGVLSMISNEIRYRENIGDYVVNVLAQAMVDKADAVFLQNNGEPTGLFNVKNVVPGEVTDNLNPIITALSTVSANGAIPTSLIMHYATWASLLNLTYKDGRPMIDPSVAHSETPKLFGLDVILNAQAPVNKILINDPNEVFSTLSEASLSMSDDYAFNRDSTTMRGTYRIGFSVIHANRLAVLTVNTAA